DEPDGPRRSIAGRCFAVLASTPPQPRRSLPGRVSGLHWKFRSRATVTTSTSLNLRALLKTAIARSGMNVPARVVSGLTPSAKALFVAGAAQAQPHGVVLYV